MYLLCEYSYDWYEFCHPLCVAKHKKTLIAHFEQNKTIYRFRMAKNANQHLSFANDSETHFYITKIEEVPPCQQPASHTK